MVRTRDEQLLLGEWACLGVLYTAPTHGFAIAAQLKPGTEIGRVWSLSRALTYRAIDQLTARGFVEAVGEEPGIAGGNRTVVAVTRTGRARFRTWLATPVEHLRDVRSELLLKVILAERCAIDVTEMLVAQRDRLSQQSRSLHEQVAANDVATDGAADVVTMWRNEFSQAALRFLDQLIVGRPSGD